MVKGHRVWASALVLVLALLCVLCLTLSGCGYGLEDDFPLDELGTTNTNMHYAGAVVEKDGWIYYPNPKDAGRLYRRSSDGTSDERLRNRTYAYYINVIGNRIWYIWGAAGGPVYELRLKENGRVSGERKLDSRPCRSLMVAGGFLFYIVYPAEGDRWGWGELYRLDLRSGEKKLLEKDVTSYSIHDGNIYFGYRHSSDADSLESPGVLCKMDFSGNGHVVLAHDDPYNIEIIDDIIYYARFEDHKLYRIKTDGSERQALPEDWLSMYVTDKFIYYQKDLGDSVCQRRINLDGSGDTEIFSNRTSILGITEHMLFFSHSDKPYVSDLDGGNIRSWP